MKKLAQTERKEEKFFEKYDIVIKADSIINLKEKGWPIVLNNRM